MTWTLEWSYVAEHHDLLELHYLAAGRICAALTQLTTAGRGAVEQIGADDPNRFRLRVKGAEAQIFVNTKERAIFVARVFRRGLR